MTGVLWRRAALLAVTLLVSSFVVFSAQHVGPGSPLAALSGGRTLPPEALEALEERYRLDEPFLAQYAHWLGSVVQGDLGESIALRDDVASVIGARIGITAQLVGLAALLAVGLGVGIGVLAALRGGATDAAVVGATSVAAAVPSFFAATVLVSVFAVSLDWLPALGAGEGGGDRLRHLVLPAIALALPAVAVVARVTRVAVRAELGAEHVQTATSRGLPRRHVLLRHVLRNAALPIVTVAGLTTASLIALSAVVERAFALNGLGAALVQAAASKDIALVQAIGLLLVVAFVLVNAAVDVLQAALDPRSAA